MSQISLAVSLFAISGFMLLVGKNLIGKVVVFIDEEIDFLSRLAALGAEVVLLIDGIFLFIKPLLGV